MVAHASQRSTLRTSLARAMVALAALAMGAGAVAAEPSTPVIERFYATPNPVVRGEVVDVAWKVTGAVRVQVDGFVKDCDCERGLEDSDGSMPEETTTFTLRA